MPDAKTFVANAPAWVDLSSKDAAASREFYSKLFGWKVEIGGPDAGGYALAKVGGKDVAGIGPAQDPNAPTAWNLYIGTRDADALAKKVEAAGGKHGSDHGGGGGLAMHAGDGNAILQPHQLCQHLSPRDHWN